MFACLSIIMMNVMGHIDAYLRFEIRWMLAIQIAQRNLLASMRIRGALLFYYWFPSTHGHQNERAGGRSEYETHDRDELQSSAVTPRVWCIHSKCEPWCRKRNINTQGTKLGTYTTVGCMYQCDIATLSSFFLIFLLFLTCLRFSIVSDTHSRWTCCTTKGHVEN